MTIHPTSLMIYGMDGLHLFNNYTRPSGYITHPTQVDVSYSCFHSLNRLLKLDYIVQVWVLFVVKNCISSGMIQVENCIEVCSFKLDRKIPLLAGIPSCKSWGLSREYSSSQLCICHDFRIALHTQAAYGQ